MKKILLFIIISILIYPNKKVNAEWSMYGETDSGYHFIDLSNTSSDDRYIYYWILTDYKEQQKNKVIDNSFLSKKVYKQTDCRRFRTSASEIIIYSKKMSKGKIIVKEKYYESSFSTPNFDSIGYEELEVICNYINN
tara:strand:+ start:326 stop:736 length:411 start_codon:yes stop_codon:yes gene_type:complete